MTRWPFTITMHKLSWVMGWSSSTKLISSPIFHDVVALLFCWKWKIRVPSTAPITAYIEYCGNEMLSSMLLHVIKPPWPINFQFDRFSNFNFRVTKMNCIGSFTVRIKYVCLKVLIRISSLDSRSKDVIEY